MSRKLNAGRVVGILFGIVTHLLFAATVYRLFFFLKDNPAGEFAGGLWLNVVLTLLFAVPHSLLLHPAVRERLGFIPGPFYGCFYTLVTIACLWAMFLGWARHPLVLWETHGGLALALRSGFIASWVALFYSLQLTGLGWQTGWTPWLAWVRNSPPPPRTFAPRGAYRWFRHPVYLSFAGLLWFTPIMTLDRAMLVGIWTFYLAIGSVLKDERLAFYLGRKYRDYQEQVPGYPLIVWGPLGYRPPELVTLDQSSNIASIVSPGPNPKATSGLAAPRG